MSRKIHKVHIALTNNNIDTTGAVSRDTISVQLKNWKFCLSKESDDHATHFKPSFLVKKTVIRFTRLKAKFKPCKKHVRKNAKMRPQLNHTETEIKKKTLKKNQRRQQQYQAIRQGVKIDTWHSQYFKLVNHYLSP